MQRRWDALSNRGRVGLWLSLLAVLLVGGTGANAAFLGVVATSDTASVAVTEADPAAAVPSATPSPSRAPTLTPTPTPEVEVATVLEDVAVPPGAVRVDDPTRDVGTTAVTTAGVPGVLTKTWRVTTTDGVETGRELLEEVVTTPPVDEVTSVGTRQPAPPVAPAPLAAPAPAPPTAAGGCDPNYSGACVPVAADVDCAGGSGNGPAYVSGPITVVGSDVYDLDSDGDGIACIR